MRKQTVKQALKGMAPDQEVIVDVYAYGISYACTLRDGMRTAAECLERVRYDILAAKVLEVKEQTWRDRINAKDVTSKVLVCDLAK